jgi:hypothetical protein
MLSIFQLSAGQAQASISLDQREDDAAMLHPVSVVDDSPMIARDNDDSCSRDPVVLYLRLPDGQVKILGVVKPQPGC